MLFTTFEPVMQRFVWIRNTKIYVVDRQRLRSIFRLFAYIIKNLLLSENAVFRA